MQNVFKKLMNDRKGIPVLYKFGVKVYNTGNNGVNNG